MQKEQHGTRRRTGGPTAQGDAVWQSRVEGLGSCGLLLAIWSFDVALGPTAPPIDAERPPLRRHRPLERGEQRNANVRFVGRDLGQDHVPVRSAAAPWLRLSLSALVSSTSSLTTPLLMRGDMKRSSCRSRSVKPSRESTIRTMPVRLRRNSEVVGHHLLPAQLGTALDGGVAVARQVGEQRVGLVLRTHLEQVDVLRSPWRPGGESQAVLLRQPVDGGRLAGVGPADECDLRQLGDGQLVELAGGGQEARGVRPGQRSLLVAGLRLAESGRARGPGTLVRASSVQIRHCKIARFCIRDTATS